MKLGFVRLLSALLVVFGLTGVPCGLALARSITDAAGRVVEIPDQITHVMAAGPPASVILYTLVPEKMIGWVRAWKPDEARYIAPAYRHLPVIGRITGRGNTVTPEAVVKLAPDVIIDVGSVDSSYAELADRFQNQTGIPYVLLDGTLAASADTYRLLGQIVGEPERADALAKYATATLDEVRATLAQVPDGNRPRVYYGRGEDGLETGLAGSINMEVLETVGAVNVAAAAGSGGLAKVSMEQILSWNPGVILTLDQDVTNLILTNPLWQNTRAVKERRVYQAPALPWGWFDLPPGVNRLIGIRWLLSTLYSAQPGADLKAEAREFYRLFYHIDLSEEDLMTLLKGATSPAH